MGRNIDPPLFVSEDELGALILGSSRRKEWKGIAPRLEMEGLPKVVEGMGGRYWPAVKRFFDAAYDVQVQSLPTTGGMEDAGAWATRGRSRRRA